MWWICAWAFGIKAFDAFMLTTFLVVTAAAIHMVKPYLDRMLGRDASALEDKGAV